MGEVGWGGGWRGWQGSSLEYMDIVSGCRFGDAGFQQPSYEDLSVCSACSPAGPHDANFFSIKQSVS